MNLWNGAKTSFWYSSKDGIDVIRLALDSIYETIGYQAIFETTSFVNNQLKIYKDMVRCVILLIESLPSLGK
jgi:hypothetical protein